LRRFGRQKNLPLCQKKFLKNGNSRKFSGFFFVLFAQCKSASNNFHRTFRQGIEKGLAVLLRQNPVVQNHDDAGVGLGPDQAPDALAEFQDRKSVGQASRLSPSGNSALWRFCFN
jgi:hypothetical protein